MSPQLTSAAPERLADVRPVLPSVLPPGVDSAVMTIPWETCGLWFETRNLDNYRPNNEEIAGQYRDLMARDLWHYNGDSIRFDVDGYLQDGQKRLWAAWQAKKPLRTMIIVNLPRQARDTMDCGQKRGFHTHLAAYGEKHSRALAAVARWLLTWEAGALAPEKAGVAPRLCRPVCLADVQGVIERHPQVRESLAWVRGRKETCRMLTESLAGFLHYACGCVGVDADGDEVDEFPALRLVDRDEFFDRLDSGADLEQGSVLLLLRKRLNHEQRVAEKMQLDKGKLDVMMRAALTIKAWHLYCTGKTVTMLSWRTEGDRPERFPALPMPAEMQTRGQQQ